MRIFLFVFIVSLLSFNSYGQVRSLSASTKDVENVKKERPDNQVFLVRNIQDLPLILMTVKEMDEKRGFVEVIIFGDGVEKLKDAPEIKEQAKMAEELKVNLFICSHSLKLKELEPKEFEEFIKPIDNGIKYALDLQKRGYNILTL